MTTRAYPAAHCGIGCFDYRSWFIQPYRGAFRYGYWRGDRRSSGKNRHDAIVTQPAHQT